jgi:hypothetical protein
MSRTAAAATGRPPSILPAAGSTVARVASKLMAVGAGRRRQPRPSADGRAHQQSRDPIDATTWVGRGMLSRFGRGGFSGFLRLVPYDASLSPRDRGFNEAAASMPRMTVKNLCSARSGSQRLQCEPEPSGPRLQTPSLIDRGLA